MDSQSTNTCSIDDCGKAAFCRGWCAMHYSRWLRHGDVHHVPIRVAHNRRPAEERFWEKVNKSGECWEWTAAVDDSGYGRLIIDRKVHRAHRLSWQFEHGPIPDGLHVLHRCDNPACVNPEHLFLGTHQENMVDKTRKGRAITRGLPGEDHPQSKLTESDIRTIRRLYATGEWTLERIANRFGVTFSNVGMIVRRDTWNHVE